MEKPILVVLAAGMGSRYGGLKQIEPVDDDGNFIIDYSIFDAIRAGFRKVVFVIKEENLEIFKSSVANRVQKYIETDFAFQKLDSYVSKIPEGRIKPWGTAHAVLCAKDKIDGDFAIINADDFYGLDAFKTAIEFMQGNSNPKVSGLIAYKIGNTLTEFGSVKRGVCKVKEGYLTGITESIVQRNEFGEIEAQPLNGGEKVILDFENPVSMNFICFSKSFLDYLETYFVNRFLPTLQDALKDECYIQNVMFDKIIEDGSKTEVVSTNAVWHGVTYKEDKPSLVNAIKELVKQGEYPNSLWVEKN